MSLSGQHNTPDEHPEVQAGIALFIMARTVIHGPIVLGRTPLERGFVNTLAVLILQRLALQQGAIARKPLTLAFVLLCLSAPAITSAKAIPLVQKGMASFYNSDFAGQETASGKPYDPDALTAASRTLPLGTQVRVTNLANGRQVVVRINDRGPYVDHRIIDLSRRAAEQLHMIEQGVTRVRVRVLP